MRFRPEINYYWDAIGWASAMITLAGMVSLVLAATVIDVLR